MKAKVFALALAGVLGLGFCLMGPLKVSPLAVGLALGVVIFELRAVKLPGAGMMSVSAPLVLGLGLVSGPGPAALALLLGLILRGLLKGYPTAGMRLLEGLLDLAPALAALSIMRLVPDVLLRQAGASLGYVCLSLLLSELLADELPAALRRAYRTVHSRLLFVRPAFCGLAVVIAAGNPWMALVLWPVLEFLQSGLANAVLLQEQVQRQDVVRDLKLSQSKLEEASDQQEALRQDLTRKMGQYRTLEMASAALLNVQSRPQAAAALVKLCRTLAQCSSVAVFLLEEGRLVPVDFASPQQARLAGAALSGLREPVVEAALRSGTAQIHANLPGARIFEDEPCAIAFPLGSLGVLYAGKSSGSFTEAELQSLGQAASQGGLGLHIASHLQSLQESLQRQSWLAGELKGWSDSVERLLVQATDFLDQLDLHEVEERLRQAIQALFRFDSLEIGLDGTHPLEACQWVLESRKPLLLETVSATRFQPHQPGQQSLMCVPVFHPQKLGVIVLGARAAGAFQRQHLELLGLLSYLAAIAWKNAELYGQTLAAQAQLVQTSKMAAVGQLAAGVAHELNTPLAGIAMTVGMVQESLKTNPEAVPKRLERALAMMEQARSIVNKLLYYSREAREDQRPTDLNELISDTLQMLLHPLQSGGVTVVTDLRPLASVEVNQNEIQQVLINLLQNARDAVAEVAPERKQIRVLTGQDERGVFLRVIDLGCGIEDEIKPKVFDPFFTTKPVGSGTGLGLSTSQQIVKAHGGVLSLHSELGRGSQFEVLLRPNMTG